MLSQDKYQQIKDSHWFKNVRGKLEHIQRFLHDGLASCMVGAGFSLNAERERNVQVKLWEGLALDFYQRLYGGKPEKSDLSLKSALKLASQVECQYGRHELDRIIEDAIPNDKLKPGPLHSALVNLPWRDIFTTNYDQLLENTPTKFSYSIVTNKDTLLYRPHPRIIKLHGSFPNVKPYIISEEDYRKYPDQHPEFVNTVRQSLIESTLCLFGFSGDDPNFLNWIGWIRDKMGKSLVPIYLFDVSKVGYHESEIALLHQRQIEIVSIEWSLFKDPSEFLDFIFQFLGENPAENKSEWSAVMKYDTINKISGINVNGSTFTNTIYESKLDEVIREYKLIRETYPGWIFMPVEHLEDAFEDSFSTELHFIRPILKEIPNDKKKELLYELEWRIRMSFVPVSLLPWFAKEIEDLITGVDTKELLKDYKLVVLSISLMSFYRQRYELEKFEELATRISSVQNSTDTENIRRYQYERCLSAVSVMNYSKVQMYLSLWSPAPEDYLGVLWKAAIMIEIGQSEEAYTLLSKTYLLLQNAYMTTNKLQIIESTIAAFESVLRVMEPFSSRRPRLRKDIDGFRAYNYFRYEKGRLYDRRDKAESDKFKTRTHEFNLNHIVNHYAIGRNGRDLEGQYAGRLQMVWESFGYPYLLGDMTINESMMKLSSDSLLQTGNAPLALNVLIRSAQSNTIKEVLQKHVISSIDKDLIDSLFTEICLRAEAIEDWDRNQSSRRMSVVVSEILRRFSVIIDEKQIVRLVPLLLKIRESQKREYKNDYLRTIFNCLSIDKLKTVYATLACAPIETTESGRDIIFPELEQKVSLPDQAIEIIRRAFNSEDKYMRNNAYLRAARIINHCNSIQKTELYGLIREWRKQDMKVSINATYSFNVVPYDEVKEELAPTNRILWAIEQLKINDSSKTNEDTDVVVYVGKADDALCILEALYSSIPTENQQEVAELLNLRLNKITESSQKEKGVWEQAFGSNDKHDLATISYIVARLDYTHINHEMLCSIEQNLVTLANNGFPKLYAISKVNDVVKILKPEDFEGLLRRCALSSEETIRKNAFNYMATCGFDLFEGLWRTIWNKIQFSSSPEVSDYLSLVMDTCEIHSMDIEKVDNLPEILYSLKSITEDGNLLDGDKFDVEYQIMRLVGYLSKCITSEELSRVMKLWLPNECEFLNLPNDVKLGFDEGVRIWEKHNMIAH